MPFRLSGRLFAAAFAVLIALVVLPAAASAAAPANDNFGDAAPLSAGDALSGTNLDATSETGEQEPSAGDIDGTGCSTPDQAASCASSVWYVFHAPDTANYTIATCDQGTDLDTVLGVWTGTALGSLTQVAANDDGAGECAGGGGTVGSLATFDATAGTDYKIQLTGYQADRGSFWLRAYPTASPPASGSPDTGIAHLGSYAGAFPSAGPLGYQSGPRHSASFSFAADQDGASFNCSLDGAGFTPCSSPVSYDVTGSHQFAVRAVVGGQSDPTPAVQRFTIDNTAPDTSFVTPPADPASDPNVNWLASTSEPSANGFFMCAVDGQPLAVPCGASSGEGPFCTGSHQLRTQAIDDAFNADPTPAQAGFTESGGSACVAPTISVGSVGPTSKTQQVLHLQIDPKGEGGTVRVEWGTTSAYGNTSGDSPVGPSSENQELDLPFLAPGTVYHYKATVTTPQGPADTGDQTFITQASGAIPPTLTLGTPVAVGRHAAAFPLTIDPHGDTNMEYGLLISPTGDPGLDSRYAVGQDGVSGDGPQSRTLDLVDLDLDPGVTYHVRAFAFGQETAESGEVTLPPATGSGPIVQPAPLPPLKPQQFKFRRSSIKLGKLSRHSKFVSLTVKNLPPFANVGLTLNASVHSSALKRLVHRQTRAGKFGVARFKVKLSKNARKLLRNRHVKSLSLTVTVKPNGQKATHITLHPKLRR
jgi:hypothetical protein